MTTTTLTKSFVLPLPCDQAFDWLTKADKLAKWFNPAEADLAPNEPYRLLNKDGDKVVCWGEVEVFDRPTHLRQSFTVTPLDGQMTTVDWVLEDIPGGTRITMTHSGLPAAQAESFGLIAALDAGWDEHFASLRKAM